MTPIPEDLRARLIARVVADSEKNKEFGFSKEPLLIEPAVAAQWVIWFLEQDHCPGEESFRDMVKSLDKGLASRMTFREPDLETWCEVIAEWRVNALKNSGDTEVPAPQLPGLGLPLGAMPSEGDRFPLLMVQGDMYGFSDWRAVTLLHKEVAMMSIVEKLTNKPDWWIKCRDEEIVQRWKQEMLNLVWPLIPDADFTPATADAAIKELREKATLYEKTDLIPIFDYSAAVIKSDKILTEELANTLKAAVAPLENVPDSEKDWHPGSGNQVLDIVHPSLWPLMYGRSRVLLDKRIGLDDVLEHCGTGTVIPTPLACERARKGVQSVKFQWLPCEVAVSEEGKVKIESYINNLHPTRHSGLYAIIEKFIEKSLPAWDIVYRWPVDFEGQRLKTKGVFRRCTVPEICDNMGHGHGCMPMNRPRRGDESPLADSDYSALAGEEGEEDEEWWEETHVPDLPEPEGLLTRIDERSVLSSGFLDKASRIQVIVKLANIHLTPDKPSYEGGSWHVEGMLNEHICATALFYYDSENITDSHLGFRTVANREGMGWGTLGFPDRDKAAIYRAFAIDPGSTVQDIGEVLTRPGRALFFPNLYQHRVSPFKLADPTRPGHRKILALFLVDPKIPVISTANVPPQQKHWWEDATGLRPDATTTGGGGRLPAELRDMVIENTDWMMDLEEAKKVREELMAERTSAHDEHSAMMGAEWNFCEH